MASVVGLMEQAKAFLPEFVTRLRRSTGDSGLADTEPQHPTPALKLAASQPLANFTNPIADLIENAVVPRVVEAHRDDVAAAQKRDRWHDEAVTFAALAIDADADELLKRLDVMLTLTRLPKQSWYFSTEY